MHIEKVSQERKRTRKAKSLSKQLSPFDTKLRQMLAYLTYFNGGIIDFTEATLMLVNADVLQGSIGKPPILVKAKDLLDTDALEKIVEGMVKIGRIGDVKTDPRFAVIEPDLLALKPMPEKFFTDPLNELEIEILNRTLQGFEVNRMGDTFSVHMKMPMTFLRMMYRPKRPIKAWDGFDPAKAKEEAPTLKFERMESLPRYEKPLVEAYK